MTDVVVVGGGLAGSATAAVLGRRGYRVVLIDSRESFPPCFKAEKIEPDQAATLARLGLLDAVRPAAARIREVRSAFHGRIVDRTPIDQYGALYHDIVNAIRGAIPPATERIVGRVTDVATDATGAPVAVVEGVRQVAAKLLVLAGGVSRSLDRRLALQRRVISAPHSLSFGFTIAPASGAAFAFDALTYAEDARPTGLDYLSLFRVPGAMRGNLFSYWGGDAPRVTRLLQAPEEQLHMALPGLVSLTGSFTLIGRMEVGAVDLYEVTPPRQPGLLLIGDAAQSACPATGSGVSKVLTDVEVLCDVCVPAWVRQPRVTADDLRLFYHHPRKTACDRASLAAALYRRRAATDVSWRWQLHRRRRAVEQRLRGWWRVATKHPSAAQAGEPIG